MRTYLINLWDAIWASFWFIPLLLAAFSIAAAYGMLVIDNQFPEPPDLVATTPNAARSTLTAIAGAMVAVTGTVFSITVVILSLTSQQFGPRLLRTFLEDVFTQFAMGLFLATSLYCLLILRVVEEHPDSPIVPHFAVALAVLLAIFCMGTLAVFIHHVSVTIQAPQVVRAVALDLEDAIERLFPEHPGEVRPSSVEAPKLPYLDRQAHDVLASREGYIQAIDVQSMLHYAREKELLVELIKRPGHFLARGELLAQVRCPSSRPPDGLKEKLNEFVIAGTRRTPRQDVECAIDELVEVAVRALSPGINDPMTAMNCIDWLQAAMANFARRTAPSPYQLDEDGVVRVVTHVVLFPNAFEAAFNQIRQYGSKSPAVVIRLLEGFAVLAKQLDDQFYLNTVLEHADMTLRAAESGIDLTDDLRVIRDRHAAVWTAAGRTPDDAPGESAGDATGESAGETLP